MIKFPYLRVCASCSCIRNGTTPQPPKQQMQSKMFVTCTGDKCMVRQRELVDCLKSEVIASVALEEQLALDARSLADQLATIVKAKERSIAGWFDLANRLDEAYREYREAVSEAEAASRELATQRDAVHDRELCVADLRARLSDARNEAAANNRFGAQRSSGDFGVYATGCQPGGEFEQRPSGGDDRVTPFVNVASKQQARSSLRTLL